MIFNLWGRYKNFTHFLNSIKEVIRNGYPAKDLVVIGVTGTDGKTTTSHLIYEMLKAQGYKVALISTVGAFIGDETIDTGFHVTTPDATQLQPLIRKIRDGGNQYLVMETTSHGLDQHRVFGCNFWAGVLTNVTHEHLDYHKTFENYKKAKGKLFKKVRVAVLNKDDKAFRYFRSLVKNDSTIISYSLEGKADLMARGIKLMNGQMYFSIIEKKKIYKVTSKLIGSYNVANILAAIGVARQCGVDWLNILTILRNFKGVPGRMEAIKAGQNFSVIVDFAHTPNALEKVLQALKKLTKGNLIVVFGCAGERDTAKRSMMGEISVKLADISIFTAEDPRHEKVWEIIDQMVSGAKAAGGEEISPENFVGSKKHVFLRIEDREKAINWAIRAAAKDNDTVVICGKGHEKSMAFGDREIPWSDIELAKRILRSPQ